jgi:hypothetical protein
MRSLQLCDKAGTVLLIGALVLVLVVHLPTLILGAIGWERAKRCKFASVSGDKGYD